MRGLELGIERSIGALHTIAYVEIEAFIIENLVQQMEKGLLDPAPIWTDVKTFQSTAKQIRGKVDFITAGYPCQPFSVAGTRQGKKDPRHLWPYIKDIVDAIRPLCCFFENVPGHLSIGYQQVRQDLHELGYEVEEGIFSAEEVGAPHLRKRLFIMAIAKGDGNSRTVRNMVEAYAGIKTREEQGENERFELDHASDEMENTVIQRVRRRDDEGIDGGRPFQTSRSSELADTDNRQQPRKSGTDQETDEGKGIPERDEIQKHRITSELANPEHDGSVANEIRQGDEEGNGRSTPGTIDAFELTGCGELADSPGAGLEGIKEQRTREEQPTFKRSGGTCWPARPGEAQFEWEEPRLESSVGFSVNGYNYREDLLRMAGNAVVEQVAELAFKTLINKFKL
jgi:DNA (cytosine-5)-methyltransferase 1